MWYLINDGSKKCQRTSLGPWKWNSFCCITTKLDSLKEKIWLCHWHLSRKSLHVKMLHWFIDSISIYGWFIFMNLENWLTYNIHDHTLPKTFLLQFGVLEFLSTCKNSGWQIHQHQMKLISTFFQFFSACKKLMNSIPKKFSQLYIQIILKIYKK